MSLMPVHQHGSVHCLRQARFFPWATVVKKKSLFISHLHFPNSLKVLHSRQNVINLEKNHFGEANNWTVETRKERHRDWFQAACFLKATAGNCTSATHGCQKRSKRSPNWETCNARHPSTLLLPYGGRDPERVCEKMEGCEASCWK